MTIRPFFEVSVLEFTPLYNTLVRSHLEYAMQVCPPDLNAEANYLEVIQ